MNYPGSDAFRAAGYAPLVTNATYQGGLVRQHGNVSFSRVFGAGHSVTAYQPETFFRIFQRAMFGKDVATGSVTVGSAGYSSSGPADSFGVRNAVPPAPLPVMCFVTSPLITCTPNQLAALADGSAVIKNFIVVSPAPDATAATPTSGTGAGNGTAAPTPTESKSLAVAGLTPPRPVAFVVGLLCMSWLAL